MWLTSYIAKKIEPKPKCGQVVKSDDNRVNVFSSSQISDVKVVLPYGFYSVPQNGANTVIIPTEKGNVSFGICEENNSSLQVGEVMICSAGGAKIVLNNKGQVIINGKVM